MRIDIFDELQTIFQKGISKWGTSCHFDENDPYGSSIEELATDFLEKAKNQGEIQDFIIDSVSFDCGPSSEPGACFVSWISREGKLESASYEWEY